MTAKEVMAELKKLGSEQTRKIYINHGAKGEFFGCKVGDLKKIQKKVKTDHQLAMDLWDTGNGDARYLAGLIADKEAVTKKELNKWVKESEWSWNSEYTVPWLAADSKHGFDLGLKWIKTKKETTAAAGWATLSSVASVWANEDLDVKKYSELLDEVAKNIHSQENRVKYTMNNFVIAVGSYIPKLTSKAEKIAAKIGKVEVFMGKTACKVPLAKDYIKKVKDRGSIGKKRKMARC